MPGQEGSKSVIHTIEQLKYNPFFQNITERISTFINPVGIPYLKSKRKRGLDIFGSIITGFVFSPFIIGAAIAIKLEDGGPIFYIARVLGKNNEEFGMLKLRSMVTDADLIRQSMGEDIFQKKEDDPRVTKIGKLIRKLSIDEFPQFVNVLRGNMSLVGSRPVFQYTMDYLSNLPAVADLYPRWSQAYNLVGPGAVGPKMSVGRGDVTHSDEGLRKGMESELLYVTQASVGEDCKWFFNCAKAIISRHGAY